MNKNIFPNLIIIILIVSLGSGCMNHREKGCTDLDASNYDYNADIDDGSCIYDTIITGCTKSNAFNYNANATNSCDFCCTYKVKYKLSGKSNFYNVTFVDSNGMKSQLNKVTTSWEYSFIGEYGDTLYLSAKNQNDSNLIVVNIYLGSMIFQTQWSDGINGIATASGTIPK